MTLEEAQANKFDLVARKLGLREGMRLLDVGCGWGGMVMHAAKEYGVKALGVTLSAQQAAWAQAAIEREGLSGLAEVRHLDYRDVPETGFDAVSSIGLTEHIGKGASEQPEQSRIFAVRAERLMYQRRPALDVVTGEEIREVALDAVLADAQTLRDLPVAKTISDEADHAALARGKRSTGRGFGHETSRPKEVANGARSGSTRFRTLLPEAAECTHITG